MSDANLLWIALALATLGMAALALTITAHWRQLFAKRPQSRRLLLVLRTAGALLVAASFAFCAVADPLLMAMLVWPMLLMIAAGLTAAALTLHARFANLGKKSQRPLTAAVDEA